MSENVLLVKIDTVRKKQKRVEVVSGICTISVTLVLLLAFIFLLDWGFTISKTARLILIIGALGVLGTVGWNTVIRALREYIDDDTIALKVEKHHPELEGRLISTIQLQRKGRQELAGISEELVHALEDETRNYTGRFRFSEIIRLRNLMRILGVAVLFGLIVLLFILQAPETARVLMSRLVLSDAAYPTKTKIVSVTGDLLVDKGDPLKIRVTAGGIIPDEATFNIKFAQRAWSKNLAFRPSRDSKTFVFTIGRVMEPFEYYARVGDAQTDRHHVRILDRPRVRDVRTIIQYPAYTGWPQYKGGPGRGEIRALAGSEAEIMIRSTKKIRKAAIEFSDGSKLEMTLGDDKQSARVKIMIETSKTYCVRIEDEEGLENKDPARYPVIVLKDSAPRVIITKPGSSQRVTPRSVWQIAYTIRDDFGVTNAGLYYLINEGERRGMIRITYREVSEQLYAGEYGFDLNRLYVKPDDSVRFWVQAKDNKQDGANTGRSGSIEFIVVTAEDKRIEILERWRNALDRVQHIIQEEIDNKKGVDRIRRE